MNEEHNITETRSNIELEDENTALKAELEALKALMEDQKRAEAQRLELADLFPDLDKDDIPNDVYEYVKTHGGTLAGAYAIYHRRRQLQKEKADQKAFENVLKTPGAIIGSDGASERLFTTEEIRSMDKEQIRKNYKQIMKSLKYGK